MFKKIPAALLAISEPNPMWFGNPQNEIDDIMWTNSNWLKSRFHFSFAEYSNPRNTNFGVMRVMNDDLVQPHRGFGEHPHRDVEICTYIVEGELSHKDSMGTQESLKRGAVQFMSAGAGVTHSEHNLGDSPLRFIQMWFNTRSRGIKPEYGSFIGDDNGRLNQWQHIVSDNLDKKSDTPIKLNQDLNIFVAELNAEGKEIDFNLEKGRMAYLLQVEGSASYDVKDGTECKELVQHDAAEITTPDNDSFSFKIKALDSNCHVLIVEMTEESGSGRSDIEAFLKKQEAAAAAAVAAEKSKENLK